MSDFLLWSPLLTNTTRKKNSELDKGEDTALSLNMLAHQSVVGTVRRDTS